jgi:N-acetylglucosamine-6-phosphate deacetylase
MAEPLWITPERIFDGEDFRSGASLRVEGGRIAEVSGLPGGARSVRIAGTACPGFIDLQVNGGGGVLFNTSPDRAGMAAIAAAHRRFGTTGILPTLVTDTPDVLERACDSFLAGPLPPGILGFHIEGPHIAASRNGTHAIPLIRPVDERTMRVVERLRRAGVPVMITLAPEAARPGQIAALARLGAVVSLGHSDATAAATRAALAEGASCFTHLFNAMSPLLHREPGMTGAAINSDAYAGIICDGIHVADEVVGLALRARPTRGKMFLVSDAMPTVGGPDHFRLYDMELKLEAGRLVNPEGSLAGAHVTMAESVKRLIGPVGAEAAEALRMATSIPARVMGLTERGLLTGRPLDEVLLLDRDWTVLSSVAEVLEARAA